MCFVKNNATKKPGAFTFIKRLGAFAGIECQEVFKKSDDVYLSRLWQKRNSNVLRHRYNKVTGTPKGKDVLLSQLS